jgi:hypothetical protein
VNRCKECKYFRGGGDFGTCCSKRYNLCYETTVACEYFEFKEDSLDD